ncbi:MAG: hypothetical protein KC442_18915 [Thermomicrobiales bacterium]|nr:hypothetical protein [Thermomicrobiales bacterium]
MPARTAEAVADAFVETQRRAISCIAEATIYGSGTEPDREQTLTVWSTGQHEPDLLRLTTHGGVGEIIVRVALSYLIASVGIRAFAARPTRCQFRVVDIGDRELVVYGWYPLGPSSVTTPHLHVPAP